jgi:hypothetical protein
MEKTLQQLVLHRPKPDREILWSAGFAASACPVRKYSRFVTIASIATTLYVQIVVGRDDSARVSQVISAIEGV